MYHCQYCQKKLELIDSSEVYCRSYGAIYICRPCHAWVGVIQNTNIPKGSVANAELRQARIEAHKYFDALWQYKLFLERRKDSKYKKAKARGKGYKWLAKMLGITGKECHIANFNLEKCRKTIALCKPYVNRLEYKRKL